MATTVTSKGQVTIPKPVRDALGIEPGSKVEFRQGDDGNVVLKVVANDRPQSRFAVFRGHAGAGLSTAEIMALTRAADQP